LVLDFEGFSLQMTKMKAIEEDNLSYHVTIKVLTSMADSQLADAHIIEFLISLRINLKHVN
jgi:hypothetical protein